MRSEIKKFLQIQTKQHWKFGEYLVEANFRRHITGVMVFYMHPEWEYETLKDTMEREKWDLDKRNKHFLIVKYWNPRIEKKQNAVRRFAEMLMEDWCVRHVSTDYEHPVQSLFACKCDIQRQPYFPILREYIQMDRVLLKDFSTSTWIQQLPGDKFILCLPFFGTTDLDTVLTNGQTPLPKEKRIMYYCQICEMIGRMHIEHRVAHRDIKLCNIIIDTSGDKIWLIDFGHASFIERSCPWTYTICGTEYMFSPELLKLYISKLNGEENVEYKNYGLSFDRWCLGIVLYELIKWVPFDVPHEIILKWESKEIRESVWKNDLFEVLCNPVPLLRSLFTWESLTNPGFVKLYIQ